MRPGTRPSGRTRPTAGSGMLMTIFERYVKQVPNRTRRELALARAFDAYEGGKEKLTEAVTRFHALPLAKRLQTVGNAYSSLDINTKFDDKTFENHFKLAFRADMVNVGQGLSLTRRTVLETSLDGVHLQLPDLRSDRLASNSPSKPSTTTVTNHNLVLGNPPAPNPTGKNMPLYVVEFAGIYCQKETSWDQFGSWHDEIYSCFSMFLDKTANNWSKRSAVYDKMDSGDDWKEDPKPCYLYGPAAAFDGKLWINTIMCEQDFGNPDDIAKKWHDAATVAACIAKAYGYDVKAEVADAAANLLNAIFGLGDDMIGSDTVMLDAGSLEYWANQPLKHFKVQINYHFHTYHTDGDAKYYSFYRVRKLEGLV